MAERLAIAIPRGNLSEILLATSAHIECLKKIDPLAANSPQRREFIERSVANRHCYVATTSDGIVAYTVMEYSFFEHGFVSMLYVAAESRRLGYGTALMRHAERECKTPKIFTSTNRSNLAMRSLLAKLGYKPSGTIENLDDNDVELVYFKRR
jgi:ribosomal protein S18 acetylase RimI-like enzyme